MQTTHQSQFIRNSYRSESGFTLLEILIAVGLMGLVMTAAFSAYITAARQTRAGGYQVIFNNESRLAVQKISRYIEGGKALSIDSEGVDIMMVDFVCARIFFGNTDNDISTVADNSLIYDPDIETTGGEITICTHVSPLENESMFCLASGSDNSLQMAFHIGDGTNINEAAFSGTGAGYQGVEVRFSVTPRNLQRWYD